MKALSKSVNVLSAVVVLAPLLQPKAEQRRPRALGGARNSTASDRRSRSNGERSHEKQQSKLCVVFRDERAAININQYILNHQ